MRKPSISYPKPLRHGLSDKQWHRIAHFFPTRGKRGPKSRISRRFLLHAVFWIHATGCPWRDLESRFPNWKTTHHYFLQWSKNGLLRTIHGVLLEQEQSAGRLNHRQWNIDSTVIRAHRSSAGARGGNQMLGRSKGGLTSKIHLITDKKGKPLGFQVSEGQAHDSPMLFNLLDSLSLKYRASGNKIKPKKLAGDKGYDSRASRRRLRQRSIEPVIPRRRKRQAKGSNKALLWKGRPIQFNRDSYKKRHVVENTIGHIKEFRRVATRYEKLTVTFEGMIYLAFIKILLK